MITKNNIILVQFREIDRQLEELRGSLAALKSKKRRSSTAYVILGKMEELGIQRRILESEHPLSAVVYEGRFDLPQNSELSAQFLLHYLKEDPIDLSEKLMDLEESGRVISLGTVGVYSTAQAEEIRRGIAARYESTSPGMHGFSRIAKREVDPLKIPKDQYPLQNPTWFAQMMDFVGKDTENEGEKYLRFAPRDVSAVIREGADLEGVCYRDGQFYCPQTAILARKKRSLQSSA